MQQTAASRYDMLLRVTYGTFACIFIITAPHFSLEAHSNVGQMLNQRCLPDHRVSFSRLGAPARKTFSSRTHSRRTSDIVCLTSVMLGPVNGAVRASRMQLTMASAIDQQLIISCHLQSSNLFLVTELGFLRTADATYRIPHALTPQHDPSSPRSAFRMTAYPCRNHH